MTTSTDFPMGLALTSLVGSYYSQEDVAQCFINLHRALATTNTVPPSPLVFHFPDAPSTYHWGLVSDIPAPTSSPKTMWWEGFVPPFLAYTQTLMENRIVVFSSELTTFVKEFRLFEYGMKVSQISANGLRFKVFDLPELWVLAYQTQGNPG